MRSAATLLVLLCMGCTAHISGSVQLDGKTFPIADCRSGQVSGFSGVDLIGLDGTQLRLAYDLTGQSWVYLIPPTAPGIEIGRCGPFMLEQQGSRINMIYNVRGSATLSCSANDHSVSGRVTFENCH